MFETHELATLLPKVKRAALKFGASEADAEDISQETAIRALERRGDFEGKSSLWTFLHRIAYNIFIDRKRRQSRSPVMEVINVDDAENQIGIENLASMSAREVRAVSERAELDALSGRVSEAIETLPAEDGAIIKLRYFEGKEYDEIAGVIGVSPTLARVRLSRAIVKLKKVLDA